MFARSHELINYIANNKTFAKKQVMTAFDVGGKTYSKVKEELKYCNILYNAQQNCNRLEPTNEMLSLYEAGDYDELVSAFKNKRKISTVTIQKASI